ncbi:MAG: hypothetical protein L6V93_08345 [Clostridiales bacterium]|nr:MAG: hypothetical protein L6V93_08345 [Clostridiales bacterium]
MTVFVGGELSVSAIYSDGVEEKCDTSAAIIKWYSASSENGTYTKIDGADSETYYNRHVGQRKNT